MKAPSILCLPLILLAFSCTPFKEVGTYTRSSQTALQSTSFAFGYEQYCEDSCFIFHIDFHNMKDDQCDCSKEEAKDTIIKKEFGILGAYYAGLTKLSGASMINFGPIGASIAEGTYGNITISAGEAGAFNGLSTVASNLLTLEAKSRKLKEIIMANDSAVQGSLQLLMVHVQVELQRILLMKASFTTTMNTAIGNTSDQTQKYLMITVYKQKIREWGQATSYLSSVDSSLQKILAGEQLLAKNIHSLKDQGFKKSIIGIAGDIIYLNSNSN